MKVTHSCAIKIDSSNKLVLIPRCFVGKNIIKKSALGFKPSGSEWFAM